MSTLIQRYFLAVDDAKKDSNKDESSGSTKGASRAALIPANPAPVGLPVSHKGENNPLDINPGRLHPKLYPPPGEEPTS